MARKNTHTIQGVIHWAKILGDPVPNYGGDGKEWTFDLTPDADGMRTLLDLGLEKRIKDKKDDREKFFAFRQKAARMDGTPNRPIAVVDEEGRPWDQNKLIGNGTVVDVKFDYRDYGPGKQPGVYPQAIRIREYKEYAPVHFAPIARNENAAEPAPQEGQLPEGMEPAMADDDFPV